MKKLIALLLCLCMAVSVAACSSINTKGAVVTPTGSVSADPVDVNLPDEAASAESRSKGTSSALTTATGEEEVGLSGVLSSGGVQAEDGTEILTYEYYEPIVIIPGNPAAQEAIQEDLDQMTQKFLDYLEGDALEMAQEYYDNYQQSDSEWEFYPCSATKTITVARADEAVISLVIDDGGYLGGAHGYDNRYCANYDTETGEKLTFDMLGEGFRAAAEEKVLAMADQMQEEQQLFFSDYAKSIPLVVADGSESAQDAYAQIYPDLYGADTSDPFIVEGNLTSAFYLNDEGVTFISGEYLMQSYAAGIIEFPISYEEFDGIINAQYVK